jgi:hypothetical protein
MRVAPLVNRFPNTASPQVNREGSGQAPVAPGEDRAISPAMPCAALLLALVFFSVAASARADGLDGVRERARWGMGEAALQAAFAPPGGPGLTRLPGRFDYGGGLGAELALEVEVAGLPFRALFQTAPGAGLRQVLFERRLPQARPADLAELIPSLRRAFGPEDRLCVAVAPGGGPRRVEAVWPLSDGTLHAALLDFSTSALIGRGEARMRRLFPRDESPPLRDKFYPRSDDFAENGYDLGALPTRVLLRWRDPEQELDSRDCPAKAATDE